VACAASPAAEWSNYAEADAERLRARVVVAAPHGSYRSMLGRGAATVIRCVRAAPGPTVRYLRRGARRFGFGVAKRFYLDCHLVSLAPDLIHFEFGSLAAERMYLADLLDCRVTVSFRGYDLDHRLDDPDAYTDVWHQARALHYLGESVRRRAESRGAPPSARSMLVPPAIDLDRFDPRPRHSAAVGTTDRPLRVLTVGRLHWKKGLEYGIDAVAALVRQGVDVEYRIVGDGELWEAVHFWRHQSGLDDDIEILGSLPHEAVVDQMAWADVLLHPAVSEAFGNAVLEAQAMELPVVRTDAGGLPENVEDGVTGVVVRRRDVTALTAALADLGRDPGRRLALGRMGRLRVAERFRLDDQLDAVEAFYRDALAP
jgi:colanic acid/amylovoran biosynthesis glycosyltransferase